jgi:hypothetical protein
MDLPWWRDAHGDPLWDQCGPTCLEGYEEIHIAGDIFVFFSLASPLFPSIVDN